MADEKPTKRAHNFKDLTGQRFFRLTAISFASRERRETKWHCVCDCGRAVIIRSHDLLRGRCKSCGCNNAVQRLTNKKTHGLTRTREHRSWVGAKQRCFNPKNPAYPAYGGRGITMSEAWRHSFERFLADMGPCPTDMSLDRIDNNGGYTKENCRWAAREIQNRNTRRSVWVEQHGVSVNLRELAKKTGIPYSTLCRRHRQGLPLE